jgi:hypothetical protein
MTLVNLFKLEDTSKLEKKLIQDYKIEGDLSKKIVFFINLFNFDSDNVFDIYKKKVQCGVSNYDIIPFFDTFKKEVDYKSVIPWRLNPIEENRYCDVTFLSEEPLDREFIVHRSFSDHGRIGSL